MAIKLSTGRAFTALAVIGFLMAAPSAWAKDTLADNYWGGLDTYTAGGGDIIGEASVFDIKDLVAFRSNPDQLTIQIDTNYAGVPGTSAALGTGYGALFFTPGANAWQPTGTAPYATDTYKPGEWTYAFTVPTDPTTSSGAGALYATAGGAVVLSNVDGDPTTYPNPGNNGYYFRQGQAVQFDPGSNQTAAALGNWTVTPGQLTFTINDNGILGDDFAVSWAETCANDVIQGQISGAPEPGTWALMMLAVGLTGEALRRRRRFAQASAA